MELCNCMDHLIKISDIKIDPKDILNKSISTIAKCFLVLIQNKKYFQVPFTGTKKELNNKLFFIEQIDFHRLST